MGKDGDRWALKGGTKRRIMGADCTALHHPPG